MTSLNQLGNFEKNLYVCHIVLLLPYVWVTIRTIVKLTYIIEFYNKIYLDIITELFNKKIC